MKKRKPSYLSFAIGNEIYAVPAVKVLEVIEKIQITFVPGTVDFVLGVVSFRGNIIPVIDICRKIKMPHLRYSDNYVLIVFETIKNSNKVAIAAIANYVQDVITADEKQIFPAPEAGISYDVSYLKGILKTENEFLFVFDIDKVLS